MKTPLGTEVDRGAGRIVLDGFPALRERAQHTPPVLGPCLCGHGRPSQLLLSSCFSMVINRTIEHMQMTTVAACDWSVAGRSHARFVLDIDLFA